MQRTKYILSVVFGLILLIAGFKHFQSPASYYPFIPGFMPAALSNYLGGAAELTLGIGLFLPAYRHAAAFGVLLLMILFLPLHVIDAFRTHPAIGSKTIAYIRLPLQFVLMAWAWWISKKDHLNATSYVQD